MKIKIADFGPPKGGRIADFLGGFRLWGTVIIKTHPALFISLPFLALGCQSAQPIALNRESRDGFATCLVKEETTARVSVPAIPFDAGMPMGLFAPPPIARGGKITEADFQQIKRGMSSWSVEAILGRKADQVIRSGGTLSDRGCHWFENGVDFYVGFDCCGTVAALSITPVSR
jgi:hypothetical protein